jgi:long-chain fatty acid transport protein
MLQAGAYWQATDKFGLELDVEYTTWSSFDELKITDASGNLISLGTNNWEDTFAIRLGAIVALTPTTKLLLGYSYDETAQPDEHFSARVPDSERQLFSVGITHDFASWTLEASYMYVPFDDRTINQPAGSYAVAGQDPNGTDAFNGTYEASVNLLSVGLSTKF